MELDFTMAVWIMKHVIVILPGLLYQNDFKGKEMSNKSKLSVLVFIIVLVISACGTPAATQVPATEVVETTEAPATEAASAYPVTIEHKYGSTTINEFPERIVLVGLTEQDALLALGVVPVATREWYGERPGAIFEWAQDLLGDAEVPVVLPAVELNFEQIAGLNPDLIVGLYAGITQEEYETLSKIAPVVAQPAAYVDYGIPWQEVTRTIGLIVGKSAEAEALIADVDAKFAEARTAHPEFEGASGVVASTWGYPDNYYAYHSQDPRNRLLTSLGFVIPIEIDELAEDTYGATISRERLDIVDVDALVWIAFSAEEVATNKNDELYKKLNAAAEGRDIFLTETDALYDAMNFNTVLSLPFVLDGLVPQLAAAVDGDPATLYTK
jgi:iron complex transport system substrate-binding protein